MSIFTESDYRAVMRMAVQREKQRGKGINFQKLAEKMRVQKSYLSRVLKGDAEISTDQAYLAAKALRFDQDQTRYFTLLVEWTRSSIRERKKELKEELDEFRTRQLASKKKGLSLSQTKSFVTSSSEVKSPGQRLSLIFSSHPSAKKKLQKKMVDLISEAQSLSSSGEKTQVYQMHLDLLDWTEK